MQKLKFFWFLVLAFLVCVGISFSLAYQVQPTGVYWNIDVAYGSGAQTLGHDSDSWLTPSIPHQYGLPEADYLEVGDANSYFDAYAEYDADVDYLYADAEGFADGSYSVANDWYQSLAYVGVASDPFTNALAFNISLDWSVDFNFDTNYNNGEAKIAIGLIDWTLTTNPASPVFVAQEIYSYTTTDNGSYSNSWTLDPTHQYIFGVGVYAALNGAEDSWGGYVDAEISNLQASASTVPEPATVFLLGLGLLGVGLGYRRGNKRG